MGTKNYRKLYTWKPKMLPLDGLRETVNFLVLQAEFVFIFVDEKSYIKKVRLHATTFLPPFSDSIRRKSLTAKIKKYGTAQSYLEAKEPLNYIHTEIE